MLTVSWWYLPHNRNKAAYDRQKRRGRGNRHLGDLISFLRLFHTRASRVQCYKTTKKQLAVSWWKGTLNPGCLPRTSNCWPLPSMGPSTPHCCPYWDKSMWTWGPVVPLDHKIHVVCAGCLPAHTHICIHTHICTHTHTSGLPSGSVPATAGYMGSIPGSGRSLREGNGSLLQYSCLENSRDRGVWRAPAHGVAKSWTWLECLSMHARNVVRWLGHKARWLPTVFSALQRWIAGT